MKKQKQRRLEAAGFRVGTVAEFLGLSRAEAAYVEMKAAFAHAVASQRKSRGLSQVAAAKLLGSSQSRVAKMEAADESVSLDLMVRSLLALGIEPRELAKTIAVIPLGAAVVRSPQRVGKRRTSLRTSRATA